MAVTPSQSREPQTRVRGHRDSLTRLPRTFGRAGTRTRPASERADREAGRLEGPDRQAGRPAASEKMERRSPHEGRRPGLPVPGVGRPQRADPLAPHTDALVPELPALSRARRPGPNRHRHAAPPPPGAATQPPNPAAAPRRRSARCSSLVTAVTPRRTHLPDLSGETDIPTRAPTLIHRCPHACAITHTHSLARSLALSVALPGAQPRGATKHPDRRQDRKRLGPQRLRPIDPLPCCSPRPRRAGSEPRCAQVAFLKGKLHQPLEAMCRRESARPAELLVAPPELVVFWFRGGGGQEFGESLESEEGLGDLAKSLPSPSSSPGRPAHPCHPSTPFSSPPPGRLLRLLLPGNKITSCSKLSDD